MMILEVEKMHFSDFGATLATKPGDLWTWGLNLFTIHFYKTGTCKCISGLLALACCRHIMSWFSFLPSFHVTLEIENRPSGSDMLSDISYFLVSPSFYDTFYIHKFIIIWNKPSSGPGMLSDISRSFSFYSCHFLWRHS